MPMIQRIPMIPMRILIIQIRIHTISMRIQMIPMRIQMIQMTIVIIIIVWIFTRWFSMILEDWGNDSDDYFNDTDVLASTGMVNTAMLFGFCIELNALDVHSLSELLGILLCTKCKNAQKTKSLVQSSLKKKTTKISLKTCCGWMGASLLISCISYIQREEVVSSCANLEHVRKYLLANMKWLYERGSPGVQKLLWGVGESTM